MGKFLTKLKYDRKTIRKKSLIPFFTKADIIITLTEPLIYQDSTREKHEVPIGFSSDGASIPPILWVFVGHPFGEYLESTVVHDYLSWLKVRKKTKMKQSEIDWVFIDAMRTQNVSVAKRNIMHKGVRWFGWIHRILTSKKGAVK